MDLSWSHMNFDKRVLGWLGLTENKTILIYYWYDILKTLIL